MKLRAEKLVKKYGVRTVVKGVSMEVEQGEIVGFLGPNGAGKTTSFYMITGQIKPNAGRIFLDEDDGTTVEVTTLPMYQRAQKGIGYLPQEASVFRKMSVEDNIMSVMELSKSTEGMTKEQRVARMEQLIDEFNLSKVRKSLGIQLSGGERRRCEIARALAVDPKFILLDEPFAGVDPIAVEDITMSVKPSPSQTAPTFCTKASSSRPAPRSSWPPTKTSAPNTSDPASSSNVPSLWRGPVKKWKKNTTFSLARLLHLLSQG